MQRYPMPALPILATPRWPERPPPPSPLTRSQGWEKKADGVPLDLKPSQPILVAIHKRLRQALEKHGHALAHRVRLHIGSGSLGQRSNGTRKLDGRRRNGENKLHGAHGRAFLATALAHCKSIGNYRDVLEHFARDAVPSLLPFK
eukprot:7774341-Pyramimonas_sp.AAC.1